MRHQHQSIWRHHLCHRAPLHLVEGKADGHASIIKSAGGSEDVPYSGHGLIGFEFSISSRGFSDGRVCV